jgi:heterodisulfide reductase subunit A
MINLTINQRKFEVKEGTTLLETAEEAGIKIPTLCHHIALSPYGACRMCLVEIVDGGRPGLVASCHYPVREGLVIETDTENVRKTRKIMLELLLARSPDSDTLKEMAAVYGITESRIQKEEKDDCILCGLCVRVCKERMGREVLSFSNRGNHRTIGPAFDRNSPVCMGCGACEFICPTNAIYSKELCQKDIVPLASEFDSEIGTRPVVNILYPQAVPNVPVIDKEHCVYFNEEKCQICKSVCGPDAIDFEQKEITETIPVGAVIVSPGFDLIDARLKGEYGYGVYQNVVTSRQFERILSASGPSKGEIVRPSDGSHPRRIAFISCVGSRDTVSGREYCSSVCCMYSTKEAIIAKEHESDIETTIFYMDMRAFGKGFDQYYNSAKDNYGVRYVHCMVSKVVELQQSKNLQINYVKEDNTFTEEEFDLVVLATGMKPSDEMMQLAERLGFKLNEYGFCQKEGFSPTETTKKGIFVSGAFGEPKDIPETVIEASSAAAEASLLLESARGTLTTVQQYPEEKPFSEDAPRIGVFVCRCGRNIGAFVDVPSVVDYVKKLPNVVFADENLYTCSQDSLEVIKAEVEKHDLTRVVVASCNPLTHGPLFRDTIREVGLNPYLFELASIREHVSWVHMNEPEKATQKAKDVVAMAVSKAALLEPIEQNYFELNKEGLVLGGGLAGMTAALSLAGQGFKVHLIEKENRLGGHLKDIYQTLDGKNVQDFLHKTIKQLEQHEFVNIYTDAEVEEISGYMGHYKTVVNLKNQDENVELNHGIVIIATGATENTSKEYLYGRNTKVITQSECEKRLFQDDVSDLKQVVMIQCVGSRNEEHPYCSRVCCSQAIKNAIQLKEKNPETEVIILYRDIRTYGFKEKYYLKARRLGVVFIRYEEEAKPNVTELKGTLNIQLTDPVTRKELTFNPDLLVLSVGIVSDNEALGQKLKLPLTEDGFFMEAHAKIQPLDFTADGLYLCGLAHSPRFIEESTAQAKGASIRAVTILSKDKIQAKGEIPTVNEKWCAGCGFCVEACPYDARQMNPETKVAEVVEVLCQACGACTVACPSGASQQKGFDKEEIYAMIDNAI